MKKYSLCLLMAVVLITTSVTIVWAEEATTVDLSTPSAGVGQAVTVSGISSSDKWISIKVMDARGNIIFFDGVKSDSKGNYSYSFVVPNYPDETLTVVAGYGSNVASVSLTADVTCPTVVDTTIHISNLTNTGVTLSWTKATDNHSPQEALEYLVYRSDTNNIDTVENIEAKGIAIGFYEGNINRKEITDLTTNTTYYFNVIVKDEAGNKTAYTMIAVTMEATYITGIVITTPPVKTTYVAGQSFDPTGMIVTAMYNDGRTTVITDYSIEPSGALSPTDTKVTIGYLNHSAEQAITVTGDSGNNRSMTVSQTGPTEVKTNILIIYGDMLRKETITKIDGKIVESFTVKSEVKERITKAKEEGKITVQINITSNEEAKTEVVLSEEILQSTTGMNVIINTTNAILEFPTALVKSLAAAQQGLTLTIDRGDKEALASEMTGVSGTEDVQILGTPTVISTDIIGNVNVTIPLTGIIFPDNGVERESFLESLAVLVLHSDGEKKIVAGEIVYDSHQYPVGIRFIVDRFSTFAVIKLTPKPAVSLTDISGHWAEESIIELVALGAISGYSDGTFKPNKNITRGEFVTVLVKAFQLDITKGKEFVDTAQHWARDYISTAEANGIVSGYDETTFGPNDLITREQMAVMVTRAARLSLEEGESTSFLDDAEISQWAASAVYTASQQRIITGYPDNTFKPKDKATRAEAITVIIKAVQ